MSWLGSDFEAFFEKATRHSPYPCQKGLATSPIENRLISVPTGAGKTAATILSWLCHRYSNPETTPRRLACCLPMRVLVEQTRDSTRGVENLHKEGLPDITKDDVYTLMGGEVEEGWEIYPEKPAVLIGTSECVK